MRNFYLRIPKDLHEPPITFPIACVAVEIASTQPPTINYAVATYNPCDEGVLPFSKKEGRARSAGRLNSNHHRIKLTFDPNTLIDNVQGVPFNVIHAICTDMTSGEWYRKHPAASAAHLAARIWLASAVRPQSTSPLQADATPPVSQTNESEVAPSVDTGIIMPSVVTEAHYHILDEAEDQLGVVEIERMHDEGNPNHPPIADPPAIESADPNTAPASAIEGLAAQDPVNTEQADRDADVNGAKCNCKDPNEWHRPGSEGCTLGVVSSVPAQPEEPLTFAIEEDWASAPTKMLGCATPAIPPVADDIIINISNEDRAKLDRIFGSSPTPSAATHGYSDLGGYEPY